MNSNIKGITIEIGGNTTKLQQALKDVNRESKDLNTELRQVERLLRLDPGNATLAAQRMQILGEQSENAAERLRILSDAQEEVNQQFQRGEIDESQYNAFNREVERAQANLDQLRNAAQEADEEVEDLGEEVEESGDDAKEASGKFDGLGAAIGAVGGKVGEFAVGLGKLSLDVTIASIKALTVAATGAATAMFASAKANAEYVDNVNTLSAQTGIASKTLQEWDYAMKYIDVEVEVMTKSMAKLTKNIGAADNGSKSLNAVFEQLGVTYKDTNGNLKDNEEVFADLITALGKVENETQRDVLAMTLFGKSAQDLNPLISAGGDELKRLSEEANQLGYVLSDEANDTLQQFDDTMQKVTSQMEGLERAFGTFSAGVFNGVMEDISKILQEVSDVLKDGFQEEDIGKLTEIASKFIDYILEKLSSGLPKIIDVVSKILSSLAETLLKILPTALPIIMDGAFQLVDGLVNAISNNTQAFADTATTLIVSFIEFFSAELPKILEVGIQIVLALAESLSEKLPDLIPVMIEGILKLVDVIVENLPTFIDVAIEIIMALVDGLIKTLPDLIPVMVEGILKLVTVILDNLPAFIDAAIEIILAVTNGIIEALPQLLEKAPEIIEKLVLALVDAAPQLAAASLEIIMAISMALIENLPLIIEAAIEIMYALKEGIIQIIPEIIDTIMDLTDKINKKIIEFDWIGVGKNLLNGIAKGIENGVGMVVKAAKNMANSVWKAITSAFDMHSPSKLAIKVFQKDFVENGVGEGILKGIPKVVGDAEKMSNSIIGALNTDIDMNANVAGGGIARSGLNGASVGGSVATYNININNPVVRNDNDIKKISQDIYKTLFTNSRALGVV